MNFTAVFCCYILLPYFASLVSPPQEATTCIAGGFYRWITAALCPTSKLESPEKEPEETPPVEESVNDENSKKYENENVYYRVFQQKLDHYNFTDRNKWYQTYLVNDQYYRGNGVIFLSIGTDKDITKKRIQTGRWIEYCKKAEALCVGIHHRNFDNSVYFAIFDDGVYKYANSEQALADVARFIHNFKDEEAVLNVKLPEKLTWAVYGRFQGGTLATLLRVKYPHLVRATLSLGAPLLAKREFNEYYKLIYEMFQVEQGLKENITSAYKDIDSLIKVKDYQSLAKKFNFCDKKVLDNEESRKRNIEIMYLIFARAVASIMQYGEDIKKGLKEKAKEIMFGSKKEYKKLKAIDRFARLMDWVLKTNKITCLQIDYKMVIGMYRFRFFNIRNYTSSGIEFPFIETFGDLTALYLSCNEFGQFQTYQNFFDTDCSIGFYTQFCYDVFDNRYVTSGRMERGIRKNNVFNGGLDIVVSNVIFVHGDKDPYRKLGIINKHQGNSVTHILQGARHCDELDDFKHIPNLHKIKEDIYDQLMKWVQLSGKSEFIENNNEKENRAKVEDNNIVEETGNTENYYKTEDTEFTRERNPTKI